MSNPPDEIIRARKLREIATLRLMAKIALGVNLLFLLMALVGQIWPRVGLLAIAQLGFMLTLLLGTSDRYRAWSVWIYLASAWICVVTAIFTNGTLPNHIVLAYLAVLICISGLIGSPKVMGVVVAVSVLTLAVVWYCLWIGQPIPNLTPEAQRMPLAVLHGFSLTLFMAILVLGYRRKLAAYETQVDDILSKLSAEADQRETAEHAASRALHEKQQLIRNISHEFRTPLNSIIGFSERLLKRADEKTYKPLETVVRNGLALHRLVSESLLLDAIEATPIETQRIDISGMIQDIVDANSPVAWENHVKLSYITEGLNGAVTCDVDVARFSQAIANVLLFCVRQTPSHTKPVVIRFNADQLEGWVRLDFEYADKPLTAEEHEKLFETHYEHVLSNDKDLPISAFALKIASLIITAHGGSCVSTNSPDSQRNTITVTLPLSSQH